MSHAFVAVALGQTMRAPRPPVRLWVLGALCAMLPDIDVLSFYVGMPRGHLLAHRGLTHSLPFAVVCGCILGQLAFRDARWCSDRRSERARYCAYLVLAMASHGVLDAFTAGGSGIAFLAPFSAERWASPWKPIFVSPIGIAAFFDRRSVWVLVNEFVWLWVPSVVAASFFMVLRSRFGLTRRSRRKSGTFPTVTALTGQPDLRCGQRDRN